MYELSFHVFCFHFHWFQLIFFSFTSYFTRHFVRLNHSFYKQEHLFSLIFFSFSLISIHFFSSTSVTLHVILSGRIFPFKNTTTHFTYFLIFTALNFFLLLNSYLTYEHSFSSHFHWSVYFFSSQTATFLTTTHFFSFSDLNSFLFSSSVPISSFR